MGPATFRAIAASQGSPAAVLSDLYRDTDGHIYIDAAAAIRTPAGGVIGVAILRSDAAACLFPLIRSWPTPSRSAETLLVQRDGDEVVVLNENRHRPGGALTLRLPLTRTDLPFVQAVNGRRGRVVGTDYRGVAVLTDVRPIAESPWFIVAKVDAAEIFAEARYRAVLISAVVLCLILLVAVSTAWLYRQQQAGLYRSLYESERRRQQNLAERERSVSEQLRLVAILEATTDLVSVADPSGWLTYLNPAGRRLLGVEPDADVTAIGLRTFLRHPESSILVTEGGRTAVRDGIWSGESELMSRDGRAVAVSQILLAHRGADGHVAFMSTIARDITAHQAAEWALRESVERFDLAARATFNVIWDHDLRTNRVWRSTTRSTAGASTATTPTTATSSTWRAASRCASRSPPSCAGSAMARSIATGAPGCTAAASASETAVDSGTTVPRLGVLRRPRRSCCSCSSSCAR